MQVLLLRYSYLPSPPVSSSLLSTTRTLSHPSWVPQSACAVKHLTGAVLQHGQIKMNFTSIAPDGAFFPLGIHTSFLKSTDNKNKSQKILLISAVKKPPQTPKHLAGGVLYRQHQELKCKHGFSYPIHSHL